MKVYAVYETDQWLSRSSYEMKGIFSSKERAINTILENHEIYLDDIFDLDYIKSTPREELINDAKSVLRRELFQNNQTQGYPINYTIEEINMNEWL